VGSSNMAIWRMRRVRAWVCRLVSLDVEGGHIRLLRAWGDRGCKKSWHFEVSCEAFAGVECVWRFRETLEGGKGAFQREACVFS
jgi:hypothetical protein